MVATLPKREERWALVATSVCAQQPTLYFHIGCSGNIDDETATEDGFVRESPNLTPKVGRSGILSTS
jgi:hypothetical protein